MIELRDKKKSRRSRSRRAAGAADDGLAIFDDNGEIVHFVPAEIAGSLRYMLARVTADAGEGGLVRRIGITSALQGEGVTSVCRSLALLLANDGVKRVCVVDLDWWSPSVWPDPDRPGVAEVIRGDERLEHALVHTGNPGLSILPAGSAPAAHRPVLAASAAMGRLLGTLSAEFDHVLLDLPAVHRTSAALTLASHADALALVVRQGVTTAEQATNALEELGDRNVLGVVLNRASTKVPRPLLRLIPGAWVPGEA